MIFMRASAIVLASIVVCSTSSANGPDGDADRKLGVGDACSLIARALAVELVAFDAVVEDGAVVLSWETASEIDNEGFNLLRSTDPLGDFEAVNAQLIPAAGGPAFGATYEYVDTAVEAGTTYYYLLEDVATSGAVTLRGADVCRYASLEPSSTCEPLAVAVPEPPVEPPDDLIFSDGFELGNTSAWSSNG